MSEMLDKLKFPDEAKSFFENIYSNIENNQNVADLLEATCEDYMDMKNIDEQRNQLTKMLNIHPYSTDMLILLICADKLSSIYAKKGYSEKLYIDTMSDLRFKLNECKTVFDIWGTFVFPWFNRFYNCSRFKLGRLQFEDTKLNINYKDIGKVGDKVLNCHIPSDGSLKQEMVCESLDEAYEFYDFKGPMIVVCDSWLLYPPFKAVFPENSNLRKFYELFDIVQWREDATNEDAWRIFGTMDNKLENLPRNTELQKRFYTYIKEGNIMGSGFGILVYEPGKMKNNNYK